MALWLVGSRSELVSGGFLRLGIGSASPGTDTKSRTCPISYGGVGRSEFSRRFGVGSACPWFLSRVAADTSAGACSRIAARRKRACDRVTRPPPPPLTGWGNGGHPFCRACLSVSPSLSPLSSSLSSAPKLSGRRQLQGVGMLSEEPGSGLYGSLHVVHKHTCRAQGASGGMTEKEGWEKRKEEAGEEVLGSTDSWQWSLNWNEITPTIVVGACPRSADDVDTIVEKANVTAILNLQSDLCFAALEIPFESIRKRAMENGVFLARVPIRDFDHADQALMLPEAVRMLNVLVSRGRRVYVHCTAGINRATLSVVGYLTFVQGFTLDDAVQLVKKKRKVAHPYIDCWQEVKKKLLDGRQEELTGLSRKIYEGRCEGGQEGSSQSDWQAAQRAAICRIFARWLEVDLGALDVERELTERRMQSAVDRANALADSAKRLARDAEKRKALEVTNGAAFSYAAYVADAEKLIEDEVYEPEEPYYPMSEECDVVTRECTAEAEEPGQFDDEWGLDPQQRSEVGQRITVAAASSSLTSSKVVASSVSVSVSVSATESSPTSLHSSPSSSSSSSSLSSSASSSSASSAAVSSSVASHQVAGAASPGASPTPPSTQQPEPSLGVPQAETQSESVREESRAELKPGSALASSSHQLPAAASADASTTPPSTQQPHSSLGVPQAETQSESVKEQSLPEQKPGNALPSSLLHQVPEAASPDTSPDPSSTQQPQESLGVPRAESQSESVREQSLPE